MAKEKIMDPAVLDEEKKKEESFKRDWFWRGSIVKEFGKNKRWTKRNKRKK